MEAAIIHTRAELRELKRMAEESYILRNRANEQLHEVQQETFEARSQRMALLQETKDEVERRKENLQTKERTLRVKDCSDLFQTQVDC